MTKIAIVTGATRGIGQALTIKLAVNKIKVIAVGRNKEDLKQLETHNPDYIQTLQADISSEAGREAIFATAEAYKKIDFLVNNAGLVGPICSLNEVTESGLTDTFNTNVFSPLLLSIRLKPLLANAQGRILNMTSFAEFVPTPGAGVYSMSKVAFGRATSLMQLEWEDIAVTRVIPGEVATGMQEKVRHAQHPIKSAAQASEQQGVLIDPAVCAAFLTWLLLHTNAKEFSAQMWSIYDEKHKHHWFEKNMELP